MAVLAVGKTPAKTPGKTSFAVNFWLHILNANLAKGISVINAVIGWK
jgi:hypothetical protein